MESLPPLTESLNRTIAFVGAYGEWVGAPFTKEQAMHQLTHFNESKVGSLIAGSVVMIVASTIAVVLRLISRRVKRAALGADDYMAVASLIFFYGYVASFYIVLHYGLGLHTLRQGADNFSRIGEPYYVFQCLYGPVTWTTKMSVLLLYRRVFTITNTAWKVAFWTLAGLYTGWVIANFFKDVFEAIPVRAVWSVVEGAKWIDVIPAFFITGIINAILTTAIIILPMPLIWKMRMSLGKRLGLCMLFALACADVVVIVARVVLIKIQPWPSTDFAWTITPATICSVAEQAIAILCASLPMTRSLLVHVWGSQISSSGSSTNRIKWDFISSKSSKEKRSRSFPDDTLESDLEKADEPSEYFRQVFPEKTGGEGDQITPLERPPLAVVTSHIL